MAQSIHTAQTTKSGTTFRSVFSALHTTHQYLIISQDRFSANKRAQELLARIKDDKIAEKQRLAPYYFGGFSHGANTSNTDGVHRDELEPYLRGHAKTNGTHGIDAP